MKELIPISNGLVIICGPSTSGKTTLAEKITELSPYPQTTHISHDTELQQFITNNHLPTEFFLTGLPEDLEGFFRVQILERLLEALDPERFTVYETLCCELPDSPAKLNSLIGRLPDLGLSQPLTVLKTFLPIDLHHTFLKQRYKLIEINWERLNAQRHNFAPAAQSQYFSQGREWVHEYTIADPQNIEFIFPDI